jgi:hypothetical protein
VIEPTVGRVVWVRPGKNFKAVQHDGKQPLAALVVYVHDNRHVNLSVFDALGKHHALINVQLLQDDDKPESDMPYAEWMPFQKGQAAKTEAVEAKLSPASLEVLRTGSFGDALEHMRCGARVTRAAWPSGVFVYHVPPASYPVQTGAAKAHFGEGSLVPYHAYLAIKRADDTVCVFIPGMDSLLAEDWSIVE